MYTHDAYKIQIVSSLRTSEVILHDVPPNRRRTAILHPRNAYTPQQSFCRYV